MRIRSHKIGPAVVFIAIALLIGGAVVVGLMYESTPNGGDTTATTATDVTQQSPVQSHERTDSPRPTATRTATSTATATPVPNPWEKRTVVVGIEKPVKPNRSVVPLVRQAIGYWDQQMHYAGYQVDFRIEPTADHPDLIVRFTDGILCGEYNRSEALGCAPILNDTYQAYPPEVMEIRTGYSNDSTVRTLKHEFGHLLGLEHNDQPKDIMAARLHYTTLPQTNATERRFPWLNSTVRVWVDMSQATGAVPIIDYQTTQAVEYYDSGGGGLVPENRSVIRVDSRRQADIVVRFNAELGRCTPSKSASCGQWYGQDPDNDTALEYYTNGTIVVNKIDGQATGWHIGYWLGFLFGADDRGELPEAFQNAGYDERRSKWWED